ncbi:RNA polymerase sigma factor [Sulfuricystis thermophila]|uniref:RNA polymerase sigma factor n=1 Tax=Sulfuricystis thermophila TaxID=2496847 RepID=UPI001035DE0E|nr:RNA polymerase sigma factor [Sulfuricystis thermophila]
MASRAELSNFLASVERRAYKQALFAVRDEEVALDIVQDCMMRIAEKYGDRPAEELPPLFQRILQNAIRDHYRRSRTHAERFTSLSAFEGDEENPADALETLETDEDANPFAGPLDALLQAETLNLVEEALQNLPPRQREAFLLRYWEGLDIAETAAVMGCTEGSVKTHCSRATHALAAALEAKGIRP